MPKFAANLTMLFTEVPFLDRFALAREAGFTAVEYLFPYDYSLSDLKDRLDQNGLQQVLFNLPSGKWAEGERGIGANPERVEEFRVGVDKAIEYALGLGVSQVNLLAGKRATGHDEEVLWSALVENTRYASKKLHEHGLRLVVEAINHFDIPGFFLNRTEQVVRLLEEVNMTNVYVQYDIYHAQREEGDLAVTLRKYMDRIGHIQIADNPGRHQPGTGEINYPYIFREIDTLGYKGYIGLEYVPTPDSMASLAWMADYGYR